MEVLEKLVKSVEDVEIKDCFVGLYETIIKSKHVGFSSTLPSRSKTTTNAFKIIGNSTAEVAKLALSEDQLLASIGIATMNSSLTREGLEFKQVNAYDLLLSSKRIGVIGRFPFIEKLKHQVEKVYVFELFPREGEYHSKDLKHYIQDIDMLAMTATTLINHTFEDLMMHKGRQTQVLLIGPSTPLSPILFDYGVDIIGGTIIEDEGAFLQDVKEGKGFKALRGRVPISIVKA